MAGWTQFTEEILTKSIMHNMGAFSEKRKTPNIDTCNLRDKIPAVKLTALSGLCWSGLHERQPVWNRATNGRDRKQTTLSSINYFSWAVETKILSCNLLPSGNSLTTPVCHSMMRASATVTWASKHDGKISHQTQNVTAQSGCRTEPKLNSRRNIVCCNTQVSFPATMAAAGLWESCRTSRGCVPEVSLERARACVCVCVCVSVLSVARLQSLTQNLK